MSKYKKTASGKWQTLIYDFTDSNGKRHYKSITKATKAECVLAASEFLASRAASPKIADIVTVKDAVDKYINSREGLLSPTTIQGYEVLRDNGFPELMAMKVRDITNDICQSEIKKETKRKTARTNKLVAPKTVRERWSLIKTALKECCGLSLVCVLPKDENEMPELPSPELVSKTITGIENELACRLAFEMGLRMSEVRGLEYKHIKDGCVHIVQTKVVIDCKDVVKKYTKNKTSCRVVPITPNVMTLIKKCEAWENKSGFLVNASTQKLYFSIHRPMLKLGYNMSFHDLRHEWASTAINVLKLPVVVVQTLGGWKDSTTLYKRYVNNIDEVYNKSVECINMFYSSL